MRNRELFTIEYFLNDRDSMSVKRNFLKNEVASFIRGENLVDRAGHIRIYQQDGKGEAYVYDEKTRSIVRDD
tara:strand:+ start:94 stop:309 length:216 start_codon:yes stop_codon:yes gene_type:complete